MADVVGYPLSDGTGAVAGAAVDLYLGGADAGVERGVDGTADEGAFFAEAEVLEEHGDGEYLREGVGDVEACGLGP